MRKTLIAGLVLAMCSIAAVQAAPEVESDVAAQTEATTEAFSADKQTEIQTIVREYIHSNPKLVIDALVSYRQQEMAKRELQTQNAIRDNADAVYEQSNGAVLGNPNGKVTIVEFIDYQCKHCKNMHPVLKNVMNSDEEVRVIVKELPIFGGTSLYAAKAALAAIKQGKFDALHAEIIKLEMPLTEEKVLTAAKDVGLNLKKLKRDIQSDDIDQILKANFDLSQKLRIMGTPAFIVGTANGESFFIPGATDENKLRELIAKIKG
jgi:protein-disulfide isomerase